MLLSSFELLFEPITPKALPPINPSPAVPDPVIVQAYFVSISNVGPNPVNLKLTFNSTLPLQTTFTLFDTTNAFPPGSTKALIGLTPPQFNTGFADLPLLNPGETGLFLFQPDIAALLPTLGTPPDITKADFAARGYVDVSAPAGTNTQCLITPQARGTFLLQSSLVPLTLSVVSQEAYSLPTPSGNLFTFP